MKGNPDLYKRYAFFLILAMTASSATFQGFSNEYSYDSSRKRKCILLLQNAMVGAESFFVRVHAAEALISNHCGMGIEHYFTRLLSSSNEYVLGCSRVLARWYKNDPENYNVYIGKLKDRFLHASDPGQQLTALESLAKLEYQTPLPEILQYAQTGKDGFRSVARWALANSGNENDENRLSEMLVSALSEDRLYAAYSFRFIKSIRPSTYQLLDSCLKQMAGDDPNRIYFLNALYIHSPDASQSILKPALLACLKDGVQTNRYEALEGLAMEGDKKDLGIIEKLLSDKDADVRVAAANAWLSIDARVVKQNR